MGRKTAIEGNEFTRRKVVMESTELTEAGLVEMSIFGARPWTESQKDRIEWVETCLALEIKAKPSGKFKKRDDAGWYLRELSKFATMARDHIAKGNAEWAAHAAGNFGELYSELTLMLARRGLFLVGLKRRTSWDDGAAKQRLMSRADRAQIVEKIQAERGRGVTDACMRAAERYPGRGGFSSFKQNYYDEIKSSKPIG